MIKLRTSIFVSLVMFIQSLLAVVIGFIALSFAGGNSIPDNVYIVDLCIGGLSREEAAEKIEGHFNDIIQNGSLTVKVDDTREFSIRYKDIDAFLDVNGTIDKAYGGKTGRHMLKVLSMIFPQRERIISPVIGINASKLREELKRLSAVMDIPPEDAAIKIKDGKIKKFPHSKGFRLDIESAAKKIEDSIKLSFYSPVELIKGSEFQAVDPKVELEDFEGIDEVLSEFSTEIASRSGDDSILLASQAIDGIVLEPAGEKTSDERLGQFSFNACMMRQNRLIKESAEGYDQVASTLYAALLKAGIDHRAVTRVPHKTPVKYIEPGLDVDVDGRAVDFKFINTFNHKLAIFSEVTDNKVIVRIAGKKPDVKVDNVIKTDIIQRYMPTVVYVEDQVLEPGQTEVKSLGRQGLKVNVYRNGELLYTDIYEAIESVVHIGPKTGWDYKLGK